MLGPIQLVPVLAGDVASGDSSPAARGVGTFSTMFARGNYFTEAAVFLYANTINVHPGFELHLPKEVVLSVDCVFLWGNSDGDTIYDPNLQPLVMPVGRARCIGTLPTVQAYWLIDRHKSLVANYSHLFDGAFLRDSGLGDLNFFAVWVTYLF